MDNTIQISNELYTKLPIYQQNRYLIDQFSMIGFEKEFILYDLPFNYEETNKSTFPTIIQSIKPNGDSEIIDCTTLSMLCFAKSIPTWVKSESEPASYNHVFFLTKYYGFSYVFYENYNYCLNKQMTTEQSTIVNHLWIPKAFVFISLYPCFSLFNELCKELRSKYKFSKRKTSNSISNTQNLNRNVSLQQSQTSNYSKILNNSQIKTKMSEEIESLGIHKSKTTIDLIEIGRSSKNSSKFTSLNEIASNLSKEMDFIPEIELYNLIFLLPPPITNGINFTFMTKYLQLPALNCYPLVDFNLGEILSILPIKQLLKVYTYALLEFDIFVFGDNIQAVSLFNIALLHLMYPLFENPQFERIVSLGSDFYLIEDDEALTTFIQNPHAIILGINSKFDPSLKKKIYNLRKRALLIVDLNTKNTFYLTDEADKFISDLHKFIERHLDSIEQNFIISNSVKQTIDNNRLFIIQEKMYSQIDAILSLVKNEFTKKSTFNQNNIKNNLKRNSATIINTTITLNTINNNDLYNITDEVKVINKNLQEVFYQCILSVMLVLYEKYFLAQDYEVDDEMQELNMKRSRSLMVGRISEVPQLWKTQNDYCFWTQIDKQNLKLQHFFDHFLIGGKRSEVSSNFILPYLLTEEFLCLTLKNSRLNYLDIIDNFYFSKHKQKDTKDMDFHVLYNTKIEFFSSLINSKATQGKYTNEFITKANNSFISYINDNIQVSYNEENNNVFHNNSKQRLSNLGNSQYAVVEFDKKLLLSYEHFINNSTIFNLVSDIFNEQYVVKAFNNKFTVEELIDFIEKQLLSTSNFDVKSLIKLTHIMCFILTRDGTGMIEDALELDRIIRFIDIDMDIVFLKKYINLILLYYNSTYLPYSQKTLINKLETRQRNIFAMKIINFLRKEEITPNSIMKFILSETSAYEEKENLELSEIKSRFNMDGVKNLIIKNNLCKCGFKELKDLITEEKEVIGDDMIYVTCKKCNFKAKKEVLIVLSIDNHIECKVNLMKVLWIFKASQNLIYLFLNNLRNRNRDNINDIFIHMCGLRKEEIKILIEILVNLLIYLNFYEIEYKKESVYKSIYALMTIMQLENNKN